MQVVSAVEYTVDSHYVLSGSEDMNIRMWKSTAWKPTGQISAREERSYQYRQKLIDKFKQSNKIRRIEAHRHLPKYIMNANKRRQDQTASRLKKKLNRQANTGIEDEKRSQKKVLVENIEIPQEEFVFKKKKKTKKEEESEGEE